MKAPAPLVSIVSVFYNRAGPAKESIQSLLDQTYENLEILIVNDGSTDETGSVIDSHSDPRLKIWHKENSGFTDSIDAAVRRTSGEYIMIHGAGDISYPERARLQSELLNRRPEVGITSCWSEIVGGIGDSKLIHKAQIKGNIRNQILKVNPYLHGDVMYRRSSFEAAGGYRRQFRFGQDYDLWVRIARHAELEILEETLYQQRIFSDGVSKNPEKLLLQDYLCDFARQSERYRIAHGVDLIEKFGDQAFLFREPSSWLANTMAWRGFHWMRFEDKQKGWDLLKRAFRERKTSLTLSRYLLGSTHKIPKLWDKVINPLLPRRHARKTQKFFDKRTRVQHDDTLGRLQNQKRKEQP